jgi:hypothetical protein
VENYIRRDFSIETQTFFLNATAVEVFPETRKKSLQLKQKI